jgi:sec-independent protein translocase protein TatA
MFDVGGGELVLILLVVALLFGPKDIPKIAKKMGEIVNAIRKTRNEFTKQLKDIDKD